MSAFCSRTGQTDVQSFAVLQPVADGVRKYLRGGQHRPAEEPLVDKGQLLAFTAPEMNRSDWGIRVLRANSWAPSNRKR